MLHDLWVWHPPVGVWIGVLGLLGVVVPLVRDITKIGRREKAIWTGVMFLLLLLELKTLYQDRREHDQEQANARTEQLLQFENIARGIQRNLEAGEQDFEATSEQSQQQFAATMRRSDVILSGIADSLKVQTGGDSFAFITFTAQQAQSFEMRWNDFVAPKGMPYFVVSVTSRGKYPLRGTQAVMMDDERRIAAMQEYNKHPNGDWIRAINSADTEYRMPYLRPQSAEAPTGETDVIGLYPAPESDSKKLTINFSAPNGYWNEVLHLGRVNGVWHQCLSVMGPTVKQSKHPWVYCDSVWSEGKELADRDWMLNPPKFSRPNKQ